MGTAENRIKDGWAIRNVRYEEVHKVPQTFFDELIEGLNIQEGDVIGDLMSGYGAVSREVLKQASKENKSISIWLLDNHKEQLDRSYTELLEFDHPQNLSKYQIHRLICDMRSPDSLKENLFDKIVIKMGLHEVPQEDQQKVIDNSYRWLKKWGKLFVWDRMPLRKDDQELFGRIIAKKDTLAGFDSFVKNRYFYRLDEGKKYLQQAGFRNVKVFKRIYLNFSSRVRLHTEFGSDLNKLREWNNYIREIVPEEAKERLKFEDKGDDIRMYFSKNIICGEK